MVLREWLILAVLTALLGLQLHAVAAMDGIGDDDLDAFLSVATVEELEDIMKDDAYNSPNQQANQSQSPSNPPPVQQNAGGQQTNSSTTQPETEPPTIAPTPEPTTAAPTPAPTKAEIREVIRKKLIIDYSKPCTAPGTYVIVVDSRLPESYISRAMLPNVLEDYAAAGSDTDVVTSSNYGGGISHWDIDTALELSQKREVHYFYDDRGNIRVNILQLATQKISKGNVTRTIYSPRYNALLDADLQPASVDPESIKYAQRDPILSRPHTVIMFISGNDNALAEQVRKSATLDQTTALTDWTIVTVPFMDIPVGHRREVYQKDDIMNRMTTTCAPGPCVAGPWVYGVDTSLYFPFSNIDNDDPKQLERFVYPTELRWLSQPQMLIREIVRKTCPVDSRT